MKTLVLIPDLTKPGGVANYYKAIKNDMPDNVTYFVRGTRKGAGKVKNLLNFFLDYTRFIAKVFSYDKVLINTSFAKSGVVRDAFFCLLCRLFFKKYSIFFRGWDERFEPQASKGLYGFLFKVSFLKASKIIVLSSAFSEFIKARGYKKKIVLETTIVDRSLFSNMDINQLISDRSSQKPVILFLSRLELNKGITETLAIHERLSALGFDSQLAIAGTGSAQQMIDNIQDPDILKLGYVNGQAKVEAYKKAHFYIFPSTHGEGMPNSVLEAMMFGLPVLTTRVGGIRDFFTDKMGVSTEKPDVDAYVDFITKSLTGEIDTRQIALTNHQYALENFSQDVVAKRLLKEIAE